MGQCGKWGQHLSHVACASRRSCNRKKHEVMCSWCALCVMQVMRLLSDVGCVCMLEQEASSQQHCRLTLAARGGGQAECLVGDTVCVDGAVLGPPRLGQGGVVQTLASLDVCRHKNTTATTNQVQTPQLLEWVIPAH
jgi:hypothetical protein